MPIYKRTRGCGCPVCAGKTILPGTNDLASQAPHLASEWSQASNNGVFPNQVALHSSFKYNWVCGICGHVWKASPNNRVAGKGCPKCAGSCVDAKVNSFAAINPSLITQWDLEKKLPLTAWDVAAYDNRKYYWICENGHSFSASPANRTKGTRCPYCIRKLPVIGVNDLATQCPELTKRWNSLKNKKGPACYFPDGSSSVWWECEDSHNFRAPIREMVLRWSCPVCEKQRTAPWHK